MWLRNLRAVVENPTLMVHRIRFVVPVLCAGQVLAEPSHGAVAAVVGAVALFDWTWQWGMGRAGTREPGWTIFHDGLYAFAFYLGYLSDPVVPAMLLAPLLLLELLAISAIRAACLVAVLELMALGLRMGVMAAHGHPLIHPAWPLGVLTAMSVASLLGFYISELRRVLLQSRSLLNTLIAEAWRVSGANGEPPELEQLLGRVPFDATQDAIAQGCRLFGRRLVEILQAQARGVQLLTPREREVLQFMAKGYSYHTIASILQVSEGTVRAHAANILRKAEVHSKAEAVRWAQRHHLLPTPNVREGHLSTVEPGAEG